LRDAFEPPGQSLEGVRFVDVLDRVKMKAGAEFVLMLAEEGYTSNIPPKDLQRPEVLFAFDHDGEPLTAEHGGPLPCCSSGRV
jgi:DMSO/TMAO reductase YedYZ molybdopterin-dependent catalytic subunit